MALILACTLALTLPLYLWRTLYPVSDWAALFLVPLLVMIFAGCYLVQIQRRQADLNAMIVAESWLNLWLKGRIRASFISLFISFFAVILLGFKAISADTIELVLITLIALSSFSIFVYLQNRLASHARPRYLPTLSTTLGSLVVGASFFPIHAYVSWAYTQVPGFFRSYSFNQAMIEGMHVLPERSGWVTELLTAVLTLENAKLWLVVNLTNNTYVLLIYVAYGATISFILARGSISIAALYKLSSQ